MVPLVRDKLAQQLQFIINACFQEFMEKISPSNSTFPFFFALISEKDSFKCVVAAK